MHGLHSCAAQMTSKLQCVIEARRVCGSDLLSVFMSEGWTSSWLIELRRWSMCAIVVYVPHSLPSVFWLGAHQSSTIQHGDWSRCTSVRLVHPFIPSLHLCAWACLSKKNPILTPDINAHENKKNTLNCMHTHHVLISTAQVSVVMFELSAGCYLWDRG